MPDSESPRVRLIGEPESVPVFNCRVIVSPRDADGKVVARAAELAELLAAGETDREALQKVVAAFKAKMTAHVQAGEDIPWIRPGDTPQTGEREYFVAVHL